MTHAFCPPVRLGWRTEGGRRHAVGARAPVDLGALDLQERSPKQSTVCASLRSGLQRFSLLPSGSTATSGVIPTMSWKRSCDRPQDKGLYVTRACLPPHPSPPPPPGSIADGAERGPDAVALLSAVLDLWKDLFVPTQKYALAPKLAWLAVRGVSVGQVSSGTIRPRTGNHTASSRSAFSTRTAVARGPGMKRSQTVPRGGSCACSKAQEPSARGSHHIMWNEPSVSADV